MVDRASTYIESSAITAFDRTEVSNRIGALSLLSLSVGALLAASILPGILEHVSSCDAAKLQRYQRMLVYCFTYRKIWFTSQVLFSLGVFGVLFCRSSVSMIFITSLIGFSWAVTQWISFTPGNIIILCMEDVAKHQSGGESGRVGMVLGIHNFCIAAPQILSSLACTLVFKLVGNETIESISGIFVGCGLVSLVAAAMVLRLENIPA
jgi:solute carrier family 45 protein 1/2/4